STSPFRKGSTGRLWSGWRRSRTSSTGSEVSRTAALKQGGTAGVKTSARGFRRPNPVRGIEGARMPHVIVKLWPGKSEAQKKRLAERIARDVMDVLTATSQFPSRSKKSARRTG